MVGPAPACHAEIGAVTLLGPDLPLGGASFTTVVAEELK